MSAAVPARHAARDVAVQVLARLFNLAQGIVVTAILTRALSDSGFGQWATVLAVTQLAAYVGEMGLEPVAVRRMAATGGRADVWVGALLLVRIALSVPAFLAAAATVLLLSPSATMALAGVIVCSTLLLSGPAALRAVFQVRVRNDVPMATVTLNSIAWTLGAIVLAAAGAGLVAYAAVFLAAAALSTALLAVLALRSTPLDLRAGRGRWRELVRLGLPLGIGGLLTLAYVRVDQMLVFALAGARDAGLYGAVYRVLDQAQFIPASLMTTLLPLLAAAHPADPERLRRLLQAAIDLLAVASLPVLAFSILEAEPIVVLLFGEDFSAAAPALPVLMAAFVLTCFGYLAGNMIVVLELQRRLVLYAGTGLVLNVALNLWLIPLHGFMAAAWVTLLTEVVVLGLSARAVQRRMRLRPALRRVVGAAACSVAMAAVVLATDAVGLPFLVIVVCAGVSYCALLAALGVVRAADVQLVVPRRLLEVFR